MDTIARFRLGFATAAVAFFICGCDASTDVTSAPLGIKSGSGGGSGSGGSGSGATPTPAPTATSGGGTMPGGGTTPAPGGSPAVGAVTIAPNPLDFGLTSVLGATSTATISQANYSGPFTLPANATICSNGLTSAPVTTSISGSTLTETLGVLGVTGSCTTTVDGAPGTSGTEVVNLAVPVGTPANAGPFVFSVDPVVFNVLDAVTGSSATVTISESNYTGAFVLPANAISCPFDLVGLTQLSATVANGNQLMLTTGLLNASLLGSCSVTVEDSAMRMGAETVDFELL